VPPRQLLLLNGHPQQCATAGPVRRWCAPAQTYRYGVSVTDHQALAQALTAVQAADRAERVFAQVADWLFSAPMAQLLVEFGAQLPGAGSVNGKAGDMTGWLLPHEELPDWLDRIADGEAGSADRLSPGQVDILRRALVVERIAAENFNFRTRDGQQYRERVQAVAGDFTPEFRGRVLELTDQLGLVNPLDPQQPTQFGRYDKTLILGGGYLFPLLRAGYAARLRADGTDLGELSFLGSPRFLIEDPPEQSAAETYAPGAADEFDLMVGAAHAEFGLVSAGTVFLCGCSSAGEECPNWSCRGVEGAERTPSEYTHERRADLVDGVGRTVASVLSASTGRPPYRPDTSDTFSLWARYAKPSAGQRVLVITNQVFVPFQTFDALRRLYLPHAVDIDVVGYVADRGHAMLTAEYLLQETLSAVRSGRRLLVEAAQVLTGGQSIA
jgi:hypothetical protein